jgi:hypothetical protein
MPQLRGNEPILGLNMSSRSKQKVGGKVTGCSLNLGEFFTK